MKGYSFSIWIAVNLVIFATFCYIAVVINFQTKTSETHHPSSPTDSSRDPKELGARPDHNIHSRPRPDRNQSLMHDKLELHKHHVISQLRQSLLNHKKQHAKSYSQFRLVTSRVLKDQSPGTLLCDLKKHLEVSHFKFLSDRDSVFSEDERRLLKDEHLVKNPVPSCAIVSSAGAMLHSNLGNLIDEHDLVLRFNNAPTSEYESDVGNKTSLRILNSQILSKPHFHFSNSSLFENISLAIWDPIGHNATLEEWARKPDFPFLQTFFSRRKSNPEEDLHLIDPRGLWDLWDYINMHSPLPIPPNPPSSGFIGLALMLPYCQYVDMFEFVPSLRMTKRCHYYSNHEDLGCTIGEWHPLAAEKLLYMSLNTADQETTYQTGYIRISGFPNLVC